MSELRKAVEEYIALHKSLGFRFQKQESGLRNFVAFAENEGDVSHVTVDLALRWAQQSRGKEASTIATRLEIVRGFAVWRQATDERTEIPAKGLLPSRYFRKPPYIFTDEEIERLHWAAHELPGWRGVIFPTLFGLLSVTGMRLKEALALDREDVDLNEAIIMIRQTKFYKSRLLPIHETTCEALADYSKKRDRITPQPMTEAFFISEKRTRLSQWSARYHFAKISSVVGLRPPMENCRHGHGPRLHDMRHRFAVRTLVDWYRAGKDVEREMPKLVAYLGHVHMNQTYWYLEAVPELLQLATQRFVEGRKGSER